MFETLLTWISANGGLFFISLIAIGGMGSYVIDSFIKHQRLGMAHKERMAELKARTETAKALAAAPEEAQRSQLAQELLEAYEEAGEDLQNDNTRRESRWELSPSKSKK